MVLLASHHKVYQYFNYLLLIIVSTSSLFCAFYNLFTINRIGEFYTFVSALDFNPNYFAVLVVMSIIFVFNQILFAKYEMMNIIIHMLFLGILVFTLITLTSRMAMIVTIFSILLLSIRYSIQYKTGKILSILTGLILGGSIIVSKSHIGKIRFGNLKNNLVNMVDNPMKDRRLRTMVVGLEIIKNHPICGVGLHNMQSELSKRFNQREYYYLLKNNYHVHNQYIQVGVFAGILFMFLFLLTMCLPIFYSSQLSERLQVSSINFLFLTDSPLMDFRVLFAVAFVIAVSWFGIVCNRNYAN